MLRNTINASLRDWRFRNNRITEKELPDIDIAISYLTPQKRIESYTEIVIGKHGVVLAKEGKRSVYLPEVAVQRDLAGHFVLTVDEKNTVVRTKIKPGGLIEGMRVVKEGLEPGQRLIVNGLQRARPGIVVEIVAPRSPKENDIDEPAETPTDNGNEGE